MLKCWIWRSYKKHCILSAKMTITHTHTLMKKPVRFSAVIWNNQSMFVSVNRKNQNYVLLKSKYSSILTFCIKLIDHFETELQRFQKCILHNMLFHWFRMIARKKCIHFPLLIISMNNYLRWKNAKYALTVFLSLFSKYSTYLSSLNSEYIICWLCNVQFAVCIIIPWKVIISIFVCSNKFITRWSNLRYICIRTCVSCICMDCIRSCAQCEST